MNLLSQISKMWLALVQAMEQPTTPKFAFSGEPVNQKESDGMAVVTHLINNGKLRTLANVNVYAASLIFIREGNPGFRPPKTYLGKNGKYLDALSTEKLYQVVAFCKKELGDRDIRLAP